MTKRKQYILRNRYHRGNYVHFVIFSSASPNFSKDANIDDYGDTDNINLAMRCSEKRANAIASMIYDSFGDTFDPVEEGKL